MVLQARWRGPRVASPRTCFSLRRSHMFSLACLLRGVSNLAPAHAALLASGCLLVLAVDHLGSGSLGSLLGECCGNNIHGDAELLNEVLHTLLCDNVVGPLPVEDVGEIAARLKTLYNHHDLEVRNACNMLVLGEVAILLDY